MKQSVATVPPRPDDPGAQLRRRREAANDLHRLACGRRDPLDPIEPYRRQPSTWGMNPDQLDAYGRQLIRQGWQPWEVQQVLVDPAVLRRQLADAQASDRICHPEWENAA